MSEASPIWTPRHYQQDAFNAFDAGYKRMLLPWHRRAGKDIFGLRLAKRETDSTVGTYWHLFPKQSQARKAIWLGVDPLTKRRYLDDVFPIAERKRTDNTLTLIENENGSVWQMGGSDRYNDLMGSNVLGVVFSEWSLCIPAAWNYIRPILVENGGWAAFIFTYRGFNHAWQMVQSNKGNPEWYCDVRSIRDTHRADGSPVVTLEDVEKERRAGMPEDMIQQEFFMNPCSAAQHAFYGAGMQHALAA